ncbi:MAG: ATP-dependent sacrificial sulfur transferase LarE [Planctomycetaceae bacterium]|nr:ATP-dependent sacrificial sulfur transferase LarE [Planctomycetaceae bacterium]
MLDDENCHTPNSAPTELPIDVSQELTEATRKKSQTLWDALRRLAQPIVAFSGGVDSALVAAVLARVNPYETLLVTADSPSLSQRQREIAARVARELNLRHQWLQTTEAEDPFYQRNQRDRCYYCKSHLYSALQALAKNHPGATILSGTNLDDLSDFRPGLRAAGERHVQAPLADAGFTKSDVRELARALRLTVHDLPAAPCLASRLAYGVSVTRERLQRVERAEHMIWQAGFTDVRVRVLDREVARLEVPRSEVSRLQSWLEDSNRVEQLRELGFNEVVIAPEGLVSGSLNIVPTINATKTLPILPVL